MAALDSEERVYFKPSDHREVFSFRLEGGFIQLVNTHLFRHSVPEVTDIAHRGVLARYHAAGTAGDENRAARRSNTAKEPIQRPPLPNAGMVEPDHAAVEHEKSIVVWFQRVRLAKANQYDAAAVRSDDPAADGFRHHTIRI